MAYNVLVYGYYGSGKTALVTSSFWDYKKREPVEGRNGRLITIGQEGNDALGIPEEMIKRFPMPESNPTSFMREFEEYLRGLVKLAARPVAGKAPITDVVLDGWSELGQNFVWAKNEEEDTHEKTNWDVWRAWLSKFIGATQLLHPRSLNANVFSTARVGTPKQDMEVHGKKVEGDPDYMQGVKFIPMMDGAAREKLGYQQDLVIYIEEGAESGLTKDGKRTVVPVYKTHWIANKEYRIKNQFSHLWLKGEKPSVLENVMWPDVEKILEEIQK